MVVLVGVVERGDLDSLASGDLDGGADGEDGGNGEHGGGGAVVRKLCRGDGSDTVFICKPPI